MGLFTPWFLAGAAAVGLPVWLHLLRKHKSEPLPFSSLMFFEQHTQSSIKHRRLRYLVLFAMRSLLILLMVLAFAHPFVERQILPLERANEVTVLAIDNSLSMRGGNRLDEAKREAKSVIGGLRAGQRAQVLAFGQRVQVMSEVTDDHSTLNAGVDGIAASDARTSYAELTRSLRSIAQSIHLPLHVHLYSDMQQTGMPANFNDLRLNAEVRLDPHPLVKKADANYAVENVVAPRRVYDAKKARVLVTVAGYGNSKGTRNVSMTLNGRTVETKPVEVPENGRATVEFVSLDVPYGRNKGDVRIESGDSLPADDTYYFSVERSDPRHALFVHELENTRGLLYFKTALEAAGQSAFEIDSATPLQVSNVSPSKYAFVVLSDVGSLPGGFENELRSYVRGGGAVLIALGRNAVSRSTVPVSDEHVEGSHYAGREGAMYQTVAWQDTSHPIILKDDRWDDVKFYQAIRVAPGGARVIAKLGDQTPLLMDQQVGAGHIVVFASTFDNIANDFPLRASFVPFIDRTARYLGRLETNAPAVLVGSFAELRDAKEVGSAVDVVDPKGDRVLSLDEATKNADRHESDLTPAAQETLTLWQNTANGTSGSGGGTTETQHKPLSLWWYVMIAVLALAVAESLLGNQHLSVDKEAA
jgi:hypothetical protein